MLISRFAMEVAFACLTMILGIVVCIGATDFGIRWSESGPEPGYVPFYIGLILAGAGAANLVTAFTRHKVRISFLDRAQAMRLLSFFGPMLAFVVVTVLLGLYVGTALYLCLVMWLQGGYRPLHSLAVGIGVAVFFYFVFDVWFQVPLLKGPLEPMLGIY